MQNARVTRAEKFVLSRHLFADVNSVYNGNMKHARAGEFDQKGSFCMANGSISYVYICQSEYLR